MFHNLIFEKNKQIHFLDVKAYISNIITKIYFSFASKTLISAVLQPVLSYTEKSCIESHYRIFSTNKKLNHRLNTRGKNKINHLIFILLSTESCL